MSCVTDLVKNMTGVYTEDTLEALNKTQFMDHFLKIQDHTKSTDGRNERYKKQF